MLVKIKCKECNSTRVIKHGTDRKKKQRFFCNKCGTSFSKDAKPRISFKMKLIAVVLSEWRYRKVLSKRKVAEIIGCPITTIYRWKKMPNKLAMKLDSKKIDWGMELDVIFERSKTRLSPKLRADLILYLKSYFTTNSSTHPNTPIPL